MAAPGRYLLLCSIPTDADPDECLARSQAGPPAKPGDGMPHLMKGMYAELVVT